MLPCWPILNEKNEWFKMRKSERSRAMVIRWSFLLMCIFARKGYSFSCRCKVCHVTLLQCLQHGGGGRDGIAIILETPIVVCRAKAERVSIPRCWHRHDEETVQQDLQSPRQGVATQLRRTAQQLVPRIRETVSRRLITKLCKYMFPFNTNVIIIIYKPFT